MPDLTIRADYQTVTQPFRHTWEGLVNIDQFRWFVRKDTQEHLKLAHDELGARHVRAVGMYDDEMRVFAGDPRAFRDASRKGPRVNWQVTDYAIRSLLEVGINPMFTTCFCPGAMASGTKTCFSTRARVSPPTSYEQWADLVRESVRHVMDIFGRDVVRKWYFEVWNEPNLGGFWDADQAEFFKLWRITVGAIKSVDAELRIGGPSTARAEWVADLIEFGRRNDCEPDYLITHIYNNDSESNPLSPFDGPQEDKVSKSPNFASGVVRGTRTLLDSLGYKGEIHWNEWGRSWFPCEPQRETANEGAWVVRTMGEVSQLADYFGYWCLSDIYDQVGYGAETFHGNYGMLNLHGLRKPQYQAFRLLGMLGQHRVQATCSDSTRDSGAIVTRSPGALQAIVYAYDHSGTAAASRHEVTINLPPGADSKRAVLYRVTESENNILTTWREMGSPDYLRGDQLSELHEANLLRPSAGAVKIDGTGAHFTLPGPGVALLTVPLPE